MINGRYIVRKKIGEGRSKVFNVIDTEFPDKEAAAKFLPNSATEEEKKVFREEYFTLQKLDHPNISKAFELGTVLTKDDDEDIEIEEFSPFITMEYFQSAELLKYDRLNEEKILNTIIKQICSVLYYLHQSNFIYYDLKAENILVADQNNTPVIKLIDLGFTNSTLEEKNRDIKGTAQYIAPELLKKESHNHKVDFYSLGILLYRIVYGKFPFKSENEIDIYKSHIEEEFEFGESIYSKKLVNVVIKLLKKNPAERYDNALEILKDLQIPIDIEVTKDLIPAKVLSDRKDAITILGTYLKDKSSNEVFTVSGFDGSGKTTLLQEIYNKNDNSIFIENSKTKTSLDAVKYIFKKIILTKTIYNYKKNEYERIISEIFETTASEFIDSIKRIFNTLPVNVDIILLFDDYNLYDRYSSEVLTELIRIFQVKGIKVILSESSDYDHTSSLLNNLCEVQLNPFTEHQLSEFLDLSYSPLFPKVDLKKYILLYSDLLPGNIKQFIKDLILLQVIGFDDAEVSFSTTEEIVLALQSSHEEIYRMRLSNLSSKELKLAQIISIFEISVEQTVLSALIDESSESLKVLLNELEKKNIIESLNLSNAPTINSFSFKKYIYSTINNRTRLHLIMANSIKRLFPDFNTVELSRQYEAANEPEKAIEILEKEIRKAEDLHAYSYKRSLIEKSFKLLLPEKSIIKLTAEYVRTLYKLSDYKLVLENLDKLSLERFLETEKNELLFIKGSSHIELRETEKGKRVLTQLKTKTIDNNLKEKIFVELAYGEFDLGNYLEAEDYCKDVLANPNSTFENQGRVNNLLSLIEFYSRNNHDLSLKYGLEALKDYQLANLPRRVAGMHVNIGAFLDMKGDKNEAEKHWQQALNINSAIGNLGQEGSILINYGVFHHTNNNYEKAINYWEQSKTIFSSLGIQNEMARAVGNMGEVFLQICDYQNAYENLLNCINIFNQINNKEEKLNYLYIFGKFWFAIGDVNELSKIITEIQVIIEKGGKEQDKIDINYLYIRLLKETLSGKLILSDNEISELLESCYSNEKYNYYLEILYLYSEYLLNNNNLSLAYKIINEKNINEIPEQSVVLIAQREYLLGKISQLDSTLTEKPAIEYFENSFNLLEGQSIVELTWKVLYEITMIYWERGNFHKTKKPRIYSYELLNMIGENISNNKIRTAYFNHPVRKKAIEKLKLIGSQAQINEFQKS